MSDNTLINIRNKIDTLDAQIHDLLIERATMVEDIIRIKTQDAEARNTKIVAYHPSREALLLKNILQRHHGAFPYSGIIALWRALLSSFCVMQCDFSVAFFAPSENEALRDLIRYYFGSLVTLRKSSTEFSVLHAVARDEVTLGVLAITDMDVADKWWIRLPSNVFVSGVLPYIKNDPIVTTSHDYVIVSCSKPLPTGDDKSLFKITGSFDVGRISVIACFTDLERKAHSKSIFDAQDLSKRFHLIEVDGFFHQDELEDFIEHLKETSGNKILDAEYLGSYPAPIDLKEFEG